MSANALGHTRGDSGTSGDGGWKEVRMDTINASENRKSEGEEERVVEEIRSRIRGWSVTERKEMGMGVVSEVSVTDATERSSMGSEDGILSGLDLERKWSTKELGGISKTVVYDVKYESS
jgi:hypothetical protein